MSDINNARLNMTGTYQAVHSAECVNEESKIWKGKPILDHAARKIPGAVKGALAGWVFFSRNYHEENDWDRYYPEIVFDDESILGVPFILVPKEKMLFGYDPPTDGIFLPTVMS